MGSEEYVTGIVSALERLLKAIDEVFPQALSFQRPGLDDVETSLASEPLKQDYS